MGKRAKEVVLLALAVVALITAVLTFRGAPTQAPGRPPQAASTPAPKPAVTPPLPAAQVSARLPVKDSNRNPFAAPRGAPAAVAATPTPPQPSAPPAQLPPAAPAPAAIAAAPPLAAAPAAAGPLPGVAPLGAAPAAPVPTTPTLSGVVVDSSGHPTALIREGNRRHFARAGDQIAGKYRVQSISGRQVVLTSAQGKLILTMGGNR